MSSARHSATIGAPVEAVWGRLAELESWPRWLHVPYASESVAIVSLPAKGAGTEFIVKGRLPFRLRARITEWKEELRLAFEVYRSEYPSDRLFFQRAVITMELEALDARRTRVTCTHQAEGKGLMGKFYMAVIMRPFLSTNVQRILDSLMQAV